MRLLLSHLSFALCFLIGGLLSPAFADQGNKEDIHSYEPPPMFSEPPSTIRPKQKLIKDTDYTHIMSGTNDIIPAVNKTPLTSSTRIANIKPPLPPKRPAKFTVSAEFLKGIQAGNVHKSLPPSPANVPENALEITPMSADDVYRTLSESGLH